MDKERLVQLTTAFVEELQTSEDLRSHVADHQRRSERARRLLSPDRIPTLSEDELRELLFDTDAFGFWHNKEWQFNQRVGKVGLDGLRNALLELITRAEGDLTPDDLNAVWKMGGLGTLLSTELLCHRFPDRYWTYSPNVTLQAFHLLGIDVKAGLPWGQKGDAHIYLALGEPMEQVVGALRDAGLREANYSVADIFLWYLQSTEALTPQQLAQILRAGARSAQTLVQTSQFLEQIAALLRERVGEVEAKVGIQAKKDRPPKERVQYLDAASFSLSPDLLPAKTPGKAHPLNLSVYLLPGRLWWGVYAWASQESIENLRNAFDRLRLIGPDEEVRVETGALWVQKEVWGGGAYFALGHEMTADEVATQSDLTSLAATIADDLAGYHQRVTPHLDDLRRMMRGQAPSLDRESEASARHLIESLLPQPEAREKCLTVFAGSIIHAHQLGANRWGVTLHPDRVRLNVGRVVVCTLHDNQIWLDLDKDTLSEKDRAALEPLFDPEGAYKSIPSSIGIYVSPQSLAEVLPVIQEAHFRLIDKAAQTVSQLPKPMREAHSPGVITYLRNYLGRPIPEPRYDEEAESPSIDVRASLTRSLISRGLYFTDWQIATFYTALQTKGFVILSGISGTGKTKLAQHFAALLPQPMVREPEIGDEVISITVQPYMLKYTRLIVPKRATRFFDPPPPSASQEVHVLFNGEREMCRFVHASYEHNDYLSLLFRGNVRSWFTQTFKEGDTLLVEPRVSEEGTLIGFRLMHGDALQQTSTIRPGAAGHNWLFVPVRPDWRDSKSLLGYYNPLTSTYEWTPFLHFLLRAERSYRARDGLAWFVILDEMNLAHVEYYFADLLSVLESGRDEEGQTREPLRLDYPDEAEGNLPPQELHLPPNLHVIGTVNVDETTRAFSPKVLDRAFTLELTEADFSAYPLVLEEDTPDLDGDSRQVLLDNFTFGGRFARIEKQAIADYVNAHPEVRARLRTLSNLLRPYELHFGYRVLDEIVSYLIAAHHNGLYDGLGGSDAALDAAVLMKVLPKFHGSRGALEAPLKTVLAWCVNPDAPSKEEVNHTLAEVERSEDLAKALAQLSLDFQMEKTAHRVRRMLWQLYTTGFAAFG